MSWSVSFDSPESLNYAVYLGCSVGVIKNDDSWPDSINEESIVELREEWNTWWNDLVSERKKQIKDGLYAFNPHDLMSPNSKLNRFSRDMYPSYIKWWQMPAGGRNALIFFENLASERVQKYIESFEGKTGRPIHSLNLNIDFVYTGLQNNIDEENYVVTSSFQTIIANESWWIKKVFG
jgi:hypothetical protein